VNSGRRLVPTPLGSTLIRGYQCIDADLCLPDIRSFIEQQITLIAKGKADHCQVVQHALQQFMKKYTYFVKKVIYLFKGITHSYQSWKSCFIDSVLNLHILKPSLRQSVHSWLQNHIYFLSSSLCRQLVFFFSAPVMLRSGLV
jgi:hypothetical protein